MPTQEFSPTSFDLLAYLVEHPSAQDTLEGIVEWWALEQALQRWTTQVQKSLVELVAQGFILERQSADGRTHYRVNPDRLEEIRALLAQHFDPG